MAEICRNCGYELYVNAKGRLSIYAGQVALPIDAKLLNVRATEGGDEWFTTWCPAAYTATLGYPPSHEPLDSLSLLAEYTDEHTSR